MKILVTSFDILEHFKWSRDLSTFDFEQLPWPPVRVSRAEKQRIKLTLPKLHVQHISRHKPVSMYFTWKSCQLPFLNALDHEFVNTSLEIAEIYNKHL